jgi:hypothetical protein
MPCVTTVQRPTEAMLETFERAYREGVPFQEDGLLGADLVHEVVPVLDTLARSVGSLPAGGCHEAYALLALLGRRAGLLGATPTAALMMLRAIVLALAEGAVKLSLELQQELTMVLLEGYCAGRDERTSSELRAAVARNQVSLRLAPRCRYLALSGPLEVEALEQVLDEAAREFLRDDGLSCLVDLTRLESHPPERVARAVLEFCLSCRAVGGTLVLVGVRADLAGELLELGCSDTVARVMERFSDALPHVLGLAGHELRAARGSWAKTLFARR